MEGHIIEEIIEEFEKDPLPKFIKRELDIPLNSTRAVTIIGLRRSGKTFYLYQTIEKLLNEGIDKSRIIYINFEDERLLDFKTEDFTKIIELYHKRNQDGKIGYLFFDEIQNIRGWETFIRRILEKGKFRIFITGSSAKLLSAEIATGLRGRSLSFHLLPLSFKEFLALRDGKHKAPFTEKGKGALGKLLEEYMAFGGFPEVGTFEKELRIRLLSDYLDMIIYRDIVERYEVKRLNALKFLIKTLSANYAKELSLRKLYNFFVSSGKRLGKSKLYEYFSYLEDIGFVFLLRKFGYGIRETEGSIPKAYISDTGFAAVAGDADRSRLLENIVAQELLRKRYYWNPLEEIFYWKDINGWEVDFVVKEKRDVKQIIQVAYAVSDPNTMERETRSLVKASKELKCSNALVITFDYEGRKNKDDLDIAFVPLWKWLLESHETSH
jgi:predicted AAA+ superfamily ATPase